MIVWKCLACMPLGLFYSRMYFSFSILLVSFWSFFFTHKVVGEKQQISADMNVKWWLSIASLGFYVAVTQEKTKI